MDKRIIKQGISQWTVTKNSIVHLWVYWELIDSPKQSIFILFCQNFLDEEFKEK